MNHIAGNHILRAEEASVQSDGFHLLPFAAAAASANFSAEAYATLWYGNTSLPAFDGLKALLQSVRHFDRKRQIVIMSPDPFAATDFHLRALCNILGNAVVQPVSKLTSTSDKCLIGLSPYQRRLSATFTAFHVWSLTDYSRVLYLEADQLIVASLEPLWRTKFWCAEDRNFACAAASLTWGPPRSCRVAAQSPMRSKLRKFNSGVVLLRPNRHVFDLLLTALNSTRYQCTDGFQTLFNMVLQDRLQCLPYTYNCAADAAPLEDTVIPSSPSHVPRPFRHCLMGNLSVPHLVHFIGDSKPWENQRYALGQRDHALRNYTWPYLLWQEQLRAFEAALRGEAHGRHHIDQYIARHARHGPRGDLGKDRGPHTYIPGTIHLQGR